ncbi:MAG: response regulator [Synergistaceae bacterium]|jgi:putative two-component system response regulator|nr:response regulator [Synergistaceae bacterium]
MTKMKTETRKTRQKIVWVDDNMTNLSTGGKMLKTFYEVHPASSAEKLFEYLERFIPDLILLDVEMEMEMEMPGIDGYEAIRRLKNTETSAEIPVIVLTDKSDAGRELEGLGLGAVDYLSKPFPAPLLLRRIEAHLQLAAQQKELKTHNENLQAIISKKTQQVIDLQNAVLSIVAELVEFKDKVTGGHVSRAQKYLKCLVEELQEEDIYTREISGWNLDLLISSAQLHDVGKIAISDVLLNKPDKLDTQEFERMKMHVAIGVDAIERMEELTAEHEFLRYAKVIAGTHHEKWDGSGYPMGLSGENIPLEGRLMAIADVYDALISARPYKKSLSAAEAEKIIEAGRGTHFDPVLVDVFHRISDRFAEIVRQDKNESHMSELRNEIGIGTENDGKILMFAQQCAVG